MPDSTDWVLYAGATPHGEAPASYAPWIRELIALPRVAVGGTEDLVMLNQEFPRGWRIGIIPEYVNPNTCVAAALAPNDSHAMLFLTAAGEDFRVQERAAAPGLIGWFHVRLTEPVQGMRSLVGNLWHAVGLLNAHIAVGTSPRGDA